MSELLRTLIVEDSIPDATLLVRELRRGGYEPEYERVDTRDAMAAALDRQSWDIIISDYEIPGFGGLDALHLVQERNLEIPFIMVTGKVGEDVAVETMKLGANDYILKQNLTRLVPAIQRELREAEVHRERRQAEKELEIERERTRADLEAMTRLQEVGALFARSENLGPVLGKVLDTAVFITDADFGTFQLMDPGGRKLRIVAQHGFPDSYLDFGNTVAGGNEVCETAMEKRERVIVEDIEKNLIFIEPPALDVQLKAGVRAVQSTPVVSRSGKLLGILTTHYKTPGKLDESALRLIDLLSRQSADIIDRAYAEETLRQNEEQLRALVTASSDVLYRMSADWKEMFHLGSESFLAKTDSPNPSWLQQYIPPEEQTRVLAAINKAIRTKSVFHLEHKVFQKDGSIGWTLSRAVPIMDANGKILEWFGAASDITERKRAEEALEEEQARLKATLNSIPDEFWLTDAEGHILMVSDSIRKSLGKKNWPDIYAVLQELEVLYPDGSPTPIEDAPLPLALRGEVRRKRPEIIRNLKTGDLCWREVSSSPIRDTEGKIIGAVAIVRDITRQKQAEEKLRKSEEWFRSIFTSNVVALAIWDIHGNLLDVNDRFLEILGYTREEFEAGKVRWEEVTPPEARRQDREAIADLIAGRDIEPYEKEFIRPDGTRVQVIIDGKILPGTSREIGVAFAMDITNRKQAEKALIAKNKELDDFAYTVSHNLKSPLNLISGYIQLAIESPDMSREILPTISDQAAQLTDIIDALLKLSRAGSVISKKTEVNLRELIESSYLVGTVNADNVELRNECDIPIVCGDPTRLGELFFNLITNAVRYRDPDKDKLIIEVSCLREGDMVRIEVKDNGSGIEPDIIEKIFSPAFTTRKNEGTGFGLAIVKKIAEAHGGSIRVESEGKGKGTTFYVTLPANVK